MTNWEKIREEKINEWVREKMNQIDGFFVPEVVPSLDLLKETIELILLNAAGVFYNEGTKDTLDNIKKRHEQTPRS